MLRKKNQKLIDKKPLNSCKIGRKKLKDLDLRS